MRFRRPLLAKESSGGKAVMSLIEAVKKRPAISYQALCRQWGTPSPGLVICRAVR